MKRTVITMDGNGELSIPSNLKDLWMSEGELVDMLHVTAPKLHAVIRSIYEEWKIQCKLPPKTKRFCPLKTFNNAPLKSLDRWGYYYFSLFPSKINITHIQLIIRYISRYK